MTETLTGTDRSAGISFAKLLELDSHPVSAVMSTEAPPPPGNTKVPAHVYHSKAWHDLEVEKLWKRVLPGGKETYFEESRIGICCIKFPLRV